MKKVIKLTESDLERIIKKIIKEQQAPQESQGLWKDSEGNVYKLPCVNSVDKWSDFVNWNKGLPSYKESTELLRKLGTQWKTDASNFSPFNQGINFAQIEKENDYKIKQVDLLHGAFQDGLTQVAILNPAPDQIKRLRIKKDGVDYTNEVLKYIPNYFDILTKLSEIQKRKLGCA